VETQSRHSRWVNRRKLRPNYRGQGDGGSQGGHEMQENKRKEKKKTGASQKRRIEKQGSTGIKVVSRLGGPQGPEAKDEEKKPSEKK